MVSTSGLKPSFPTHMPDAESMSNWWSERPPEIAIRWREPHHPRSYPLFLTALCPSSGPPLLQGLKAWTLCLNVGLFWRAFSAPKLLVQLTEPFLANFSLWPILQSLFPTGVNPEDTYNELPDYKSPSQLVSTYNIWVQMITLYLTSDVTLAN